MTNALDTTFREEVEAKPLSLFERAIDNAKDFDKLKASLLDPKRHINNIGGKDRVNAGGWQVIGAALGVRVEIISKNSQGTPGAFREILEAANGKSIVSYSVTVRATAGERLQERTGRCDSSESKHAQYEHKVESVAFTRAFNRAVCAIVGGEPSDNADDAESDQEAGREAPRARQYGTGELTTLHSKKGCPSGTLRQWLIANVPRFTDKSTKITPEQSVVAFEKLSAL